MMNVDELRDGVEAQQWFHQIDLGHGIITPGPDDSAAKLVDAEFPVDLTGKSVLDIGTFDGFFAFEAERRGAARVVAADRFIWEAGPWSKAAFDFAHAALNSRVEAVVMSIEEMTPELLGTFDLVIFMGILYHAPDPLGYLRVCHSMCNNEGLAIVETHCDANDYNRPAMVFYPGTTLNDDPTNYWGPNRQAVDAMLVEVGFASLYHPPLADSGRYTVHAHVASGRGNEIPVPTVLEPIDTVRTRAATLARAGRALVANIRRRGRNR